MLTTFTLICLFACHLVLLSQVPLSGYVHGGYETGFFGVTSMCKAAHGTGAQEWERFRLVTEG
jgi:hypothetical protein